MSFCTHAIQGDDVFVVDDAEADARFAANSLVTGDPNIRFYAGAPLRTDCGRRIGTLCVLDRKPRSISEDEKDTLRTLADKTMKAFASRAGHSAAIRQPFER